MKVLIACEESQTVCKAFRARGHEAYSCDIQEPSGGKPEWHILGDALKAIEGGQVTTMDGQAHVIPRFGWDLIIAHPPCTFISNAGACRLYPKKGVLNLERFANGLKAKLFLWRSIFTATLALEKSVLKTLFQVRFSKCRNLPRLCSRLNTATRSVRKHCCGSSA